MIEIKAASRLALVAYDKTWIKKMDKRRAYKPPKWKGQQKPRQLDDHIFSMQPSALAQNLRNVYKDNYRGAMGALTMYKNRQGKNLLSPDRNRLDQAKDALRKLYKKDEHEKDTGNKTPDRVEPNDKDEPADVGNAVGSEPIGSRPTTRTV